MLIRPEMRTRLAQLWKSWPGSLLRLSLAILPLAWLSRTLDFAEIARGLRSIGVLPIAAAVALVMFSTIVGAVRWRVLLSAYGGHHLPSIARLWRETLVGSYFAMLPSGLAGDALRGHRVRQHVDSYSVSYTVIAMERICGLIALLFVAVLPAVWGPPSTNLTLRTSQVMAFGLLLATLVGISLPSIVDHHPAWRSVMARIPFIGPMILRVPSARSPAKLTIAVGLSLITQGAGFATIVVLAVALFPSVTPGACIEVVPAMILFSYIPIAPAGLGQREAIFTYFFGLIGVPSEVAVSVSLLFLFALCVTALVGGILHGSSGRRSSSALPRDVLSDHSAPASSASSGAGPSMATTRRE
jgi:uncharacterized membrane protein YbhN (UPF0104 family)